MGNDNWMTPRDPYFARWHSQYGFTMDAAASHENALVRPHSLACHYIGPWGGSTWRLPQAGEFCPRCDTYVGGYHTIDDNGLKQSYKGQKVFCNPPYGGGEPAKWVKLAAESSHDEGSLWFLLLSPATDTKWFHRFIWDDELDRPRYRASLKFPPGRIPFIDPEAKGRVHPPKGNMIVVFHPHEVAA